ncbi:hypothetical protein FGADI_9219 [Fusarium gaditjirri]|uniref:Uncharacterized protein n=1 Tax=Fusarium gaditjirri TaxID=282569 RepID=A0A8H4WT38_9HYPO|nr:hypothetical protein FGADI_9219 [Fusarium gaditjirri]
MAHHSRMRLNLKVKDQSLLNVTTTGIIRISAQEPQEPRPKRSNLINLTSRASQTTLEAEIAALPRRNPHQSSTSAENSARESLDGDGGMEELIDKEWGETPRP